MLGPEYRNLLEYVNMMATYNKKTVDKAIKKNPRIKPKEAKLIRRLLKGRKVGESQNFLRFLLT